jgi:hypothetical protein
LAKDAFLRRLPSVVDPAQVVHLEALVFSLDAIAASMAAIRAITMACREKIGEAGRQVHVALFTHAWTIVDCVHVVRQVLGALDYRSDLADAFREKHGSATALRNKMDHLTQNARNVGYAKGRPPVFGALGYFCIPAEHIRFDDGRQTVSGGVILMISMGRLAEGTSAPLVNPGGRKIRGVASLFRLDAFDQGLELEEAAEDLGPLVVEMNEFYEAQCREAAYALSEEHKVPIEALLAHPGGGLTIGMKVSFPEVVLELPKASNGAEAPPQRD